MLKTGQINTIIMQKNYKCTVCLTDILYILCLKSCYEAVRTGCEKFLSRHGSPICSMCKILLEGANEWKKMGRHSII